jgi:imidazolonepropionase-like amidohydrolase
MGGDLLIKAGRLVLPEQGVVRERMGIRVRDGVIAAVEPIGSASGADRVIDLGGMTVLPGLIDCHTHLTVRHEMKDIIEQLRHTPAHYALESIANVRMKLLSGFTTVREAGSYWAFVDVALRDAIARGDVVGPRILAAGAMITMTGGAGAITGLAPEISLPTMLQYGKANGVVSIQERVRAVASHGADVIKIFASGAVISHGRNLPTSCEYSPEELRAAVEEASRLGLRVMAHAHSATAVKNAVNAGVASIEHGTMMDEEAAALMKERGTYLVPTLSVRDCMGEGSHWDAEYLAKAKAVVSQHGAAFQRALRAGVKVALGSDSVVCPHDTGARELHYMVEYGMTPMAAVRAATVDAAELLGDSKIGAVAPGMRADLIGVRGDPLADVDLFSKVDFVMKDGVSYKEPTT